MTEIRTIAIVGAGVVGASWAALFLSKGLKVRITDATPGFGAPLRKNITAAWPHLAALDTLPDTPPWQALTLFPTIAEACTGADFVQECGPDRIAIKQEIVAHIETALGDSAIIASSTSSLLASDIQARARRPDRILVAHPMNPPHLVPLVEMVAGDMTAPEAMQTARAFYDSIDRVTVIVRKERIGHLANRLTSALYREAVNIVAEGIATVEDVDRAIAWGPGMRWAFMGPHLIYHLGGGAGGYQHYLDHLGPTQEARWQDLGTPTLDAATVTALVEGLKEELGRLDPARLTEDRDSALVALTKLKRALPF